MPHPLIPDLEILASTTAAEQGLAVCGVQLLTHMNPMTVHVQIRHLGEEDISLEDCSQLSNALGEAIENSELINQAYVLEVSSPGISDRLNSDREFQTFRGFPVEVSFNKINGSEVLQEGLLLERSNQHVHLNIKGRIDRIPIEEVNFVRLTSPTG